MIEWRRADEGPNVASAVGGAGEAAPDEPPLQRFLMHVPATAIIEERDARLQEIAESLGQVGMNAGPERMLSRFGAGVMSEILEARIETGRQQAEAKLAIGPDWRLTVEKVAFNEVEGLNCVFRAVSAPQAAADAAALGAEDAAGRAPDADAPTLTRMPASVAVEPGDRVHCRQSGVLKVELVDEARAMLPIGGPVTEASWPAGWWHAAPDGVTTAVEASGRDYGLPYIDIRLQGRAAGQSQIAIRFVAPASLPRGESSLVAFRLPALVASGSIPEQVTPLLSLDQFGESGVYLSTTTSSLARLTAANLVAGARETFFAILDETQTVMPGFTLWFNAERDIDCVLRLGMPCLLEASRREVPWPEYEQATADILVGAPDVPRPISEALLGARPGETKTVSLSPSAGCEGLVTLTIEAVYRTGVDTTTSGARPKSPAPSGPKGRAATRGGRKRRRD